MENIEEKIREALEKAYGCQNDDDNSDNIEILKQDLKDFQSVDKDSVDEVIACLARHAEYLDDCYQSVFQNLFEYIETQFLPSKIHELEQKQKKNKKKVIVVILDN